MDRVVGINTFYVGSGDFQMEIKDKELLIGVCIDTYMYIKAILPYSIHKQVSLSERLCIYDLLKCFYVTYTVSL